MDAGTILNIVFGIIGVVGTIFGVVSWYSANKTTKTYEYLFRVAEKNIEKDITEEELGKRREDIKKATQEFQSLQNQIRKEIPIEAKRTVLRDRLNSEMESLNRTYNSVKNLNAELLHLGDTTNIPPDLLKTIANEISPEYLIRERQSNLKTYLTIITTAAAVLSALLPSYIRNFVNIPLFILTIPILARLLQLSIPQNPLERKKFRSRVKYIIMIIAGVILLGIALLFGSLYYSYMNYYMNYAYSQYNSSYDMYITVTGISTILSLLCFGYGIFLYRAYKRTYENS